MTQSNGNGAHELSAHEQYAAVSKAKRFTAEPVLVEFPSGLAALIRPVGLDLLIKTGRIPDFLTPMIMDALNGKAPQQPTIDQISQAEELVDYLNTLCELAFVEPKVVAQPQGEEEISPDDIDLSDKFVVQQMLGQPRKWLENFRFNPTPDVRPVGAESGLSPETLETPEPEAQSESRQSV